MEKQWYKTKTHSIGTVCSALNFLTKNGIDIISTKIVPTGNYSEMYFIFYFNDNELNI